MQYHFCIYNKPPSHQQIELFAPFKTKKLEEKMQKYWG